MDFKPMIKAREALDSLWEKAWLRGRCWGLKLKRQNNPYRATNITIAIGSELVSISQREDGVLRIHEFSRTKDTCLGKGIKKILQEEGLSIEE